MHILNSVLISHKYIPQTLPLTHIPQTPFQLFFLQDYNRITDKMEISLL